MDFSIGSLGRKISWVNDKIESFVVSFGGLLILLFLLGVFFDVSSRLFGFTISWMQEITTFIFVWAVFLGASIIYKKGALYTINILPKNLPSAAVKMFHVLIFSVNAFCIFILLKYGFELASMGIGRTSQPSGIRIVYAFASIPVSAALMVIFMIEILLGIFLKRDKNSG